MESIAAATQDEVYTLSDGARVWVHARASLPTIHGTFEVVAFRNERDGKEHLALVSGPLDPEAVTPVRLHSECLTGDALGSIRCDCRAQLESAEASLAEAPGGVLLYMRQEGRGIGLANKIAAYALQDEGLDTVDANLHLGFDTDLRTYDVAAGMLHLLSVGRVALYTNNPRKVFGLKSEGIEVVERVPLKVGLRPENAFYLSTKRDRCGHLL